MPSRHRTRIGYTIASWTLHTDPVQAGCYQPPQGGVYFLWYGNDSGFSTFENMDDDATNPRSRAYKEIVHVKSQPALITGTTRVARTWNSGAMVDLDVEHLFVAPGNLEFPDTAFDWAGMVVDLADRVQGSLTTKSQLLVTFAELAKTFRMVTNPFGVLTKNWRSIAGKASARTLSREGAKLWLEGRYGWNSAWLDLRNFSKSCQKLDHFRVDRAVWDDDPRFSAKRVVDLSFPSPCGFTDSQLAAWIYGDSLSDPMNGMPQTMLHGGCRTKVRSGRATAIVSCRRLLASVPVLDAAQLWLNAFGLDTSVKTVAEAVWELVPYSFVVDWFVDHKQLYVPQARNRLRSEGVYNLGFSVKEEYNYDAEFLPSGCWIQIPAPVGLHSCTGTLRSIQPGTYTRYRRNVGIPVDESALKNEGLSITHCADALALLRRFFA